MRSRELLALPATVVLALVFSGALRILGPIALWIGAWFVWWPYRRHTIGRTLRNLLLLFLALWILHQARWVVYPLVGGVLLAYVLSPSVDWLERRRVRRPLAVLLSLVPLGAVTALAFLLLVPAVLGQVSAMIQNLPAAYEHVERSLRPTLERAGLVSRELSPLGGGSIHTPGSGPADSVAGRTPFSGAPDSAAGRPPYGRESAAAESAYARGDAAAESTTAASANSTAAPSASTPAWLRQIMSHAESVLRTTLSGLSGVGKGLGKVLRWLGVLVLMPFVAFYLLLDWNRIGAGLLSWIPTSRHALACRLSQDLKISLSVYLRGQLIVAAAEAVLFSIIYKIAGIGDPIGLGVLSGLFSLIPFLGFAGTILMVVLAGITGPEPLSTLIKAGIGLAVINVFEGQVLVPKIQGSGFGLHPLAVIMGVLFFGTLFGFVGVILAVPAMAMIKGFLPELRRSWDLRVLQTGESPSRMDDPPG